MDGMDATEKTVSRVLRRASGVWRAMSVPIQPPNYEEVKLSAAGVDRIIAAVEGTGRVRAPRELDREKLRKALSRCWYHHAENRFFKATRDEAEADRRRIDDIVKTLERLLQLLDASHEPDTSHVICWLAWNGDSEVPRVVHIENLEGFKHLFGWTHFFFKHAPPESVEKLAWLASNVESLQRLKVAATLSSHEMQKIAEITSKVSLKDILASSFPEIYLEYFEREPGSGRLKDGCANSPYIRFALAVGEAFGVDLKAETIIKYLQHWKKNRSK